MFSIKATGKIAKALVYEDWKGIDTVKKYAKPKNPQTDIQQGQRNYMKEAIILWKSEDLKAVDKEAWDYFAKQSKKTLSGMNSFNSNVINALKVNKNWVQLYNCVISDITGIGCTVTINIDSDQNGKLYIGEYKKLMLTEFSGVFDTDHYTFTITGLDLKTKYSFYIKNNAVDELARTGIYNFITTSVVGNNWDVSKAVYSGKSKSFVDQDAYMYSFTFNDIGTILYVFGATDGYVFQYDLSIAWDISTAVYSGKYKNISYQDTFFPSMFFNLDGTKFYGFGAYMYRVFQYSLSTPWEINTATYEKSTPFMFDYGFSVSACRISLNGEHLYTGVGDDNKIHQYDLPVPWDVGSFNLSAKAKYIGDQDSIIQNFVFKTDGSKIYVLGLDTVTVYQYSLSTPWDISTAIYEGKYKLVSGEESDPNDLSFNADGYLFYIFGHALSKIFQYTI